MNNLYSKVAVASLCTALSFTWGGNKEAKAATFSLPSTITSQVLDFSPFDGQADIIYTDNLPFIPVARGSIAEVAQLTEFNISSFSFTPNTIISSAILQVQIREFSLTGIGIDRLTNPGRLGIFGYVGNRKIEASDLGAGVF